MYDPGLRMLSKYMRSLIDGAITNQEQEENINVTTTFPFLITLSFGI